LQKIFFQEIAVLHLDLFQLINLCRGTIFSL